MAGPGSLRPGATSIAGVANFGDLQNEIYLAGLSGVVPSLPMSFAELERRAELALPPGTWSYVAGGAGDEHTQRSNRTAFDHWGVVPRMLRASTDRDLSVELFGMTFGTPVFLAPIGVIGICTQDGHGDLAAARAAAATGVPMVASTLSEDPLEDVAAEFGQTPGFFQLYCPTDPEVAASLVHRAEAAGYRAIVVTLDTWVTGWRPRDLATSNFPQLRGRCLKTYFSDPVFRSRLAKPPEEDPGAAILAWALMFGRPLAWDDLAWLRSLTALPLVLKGICHPGDGVRSGSDVVKALALGATAVGIGRPYVYGAALGGTDGIVHVLRTILAEADLLMAVDGYPALADLGRDAIRRT